MPSKRKLLKRLNQKLSNNKIPLLNWYILISGNIVVDLAPVRGKLINLIINNMIDFFLAFWYKLFED